MILIYYTDILKYIVIVNFISVIFCENYTGESAMSLENKYQTELGDGRIQCGICPRGCILSAGDRGFCHVRQNTGERIELTAYGYTTGLAVDPIEKKPLFHFLPGTKVLSFGTLGCNMGCLFCQNWSISKSKAGNEGQYRALPQNIAETALKQDCQSVAFTYNEPTIFFEYAIDTAKECRQRNIKTIAVTAGSINSAPRAEFYRWIDAANVDLKAFDSDFYRRNCFAKFEPILDTIKYLRNETNVWLELTTLLIEGENDSPEEIRRECDWIAEKIGTVTPLHFSAFRPAWKFRDRPVTSLSTLLSAYRIAKTAGLKHVYLGNVRHDQSSTTYCQQCCKPIVTRGAFAPETVKINAEGRCQYCGAPVAGFWHLS